MSIQITDKKYIKDGIEYDRVTVILDIIRNDGLDKFKKAMGEDYVNQVFEAAGKRGTAFHSLAAKYAETKSDSIIKALEFSESEHLENFKLFINWFDTNVEKVIAVEQSYYDEKLKVAGTADLIAMVKGKLTLVDYKTGSKVQDIVRLQTACYSHMSGLPIKQRAVLHIHKGKLKYIPIKTAQSLDYNLFLYVYHLYKNFGGNNGKGK